MTPKEFREERGFKGSDFQVLTSTGINIDYHKIDQFALEYHKYMEKKPGYCSCEMPDPFDEFEKHLCNKCGGFMLPE